MAEREGRPRPPKPPLVGITSHDPAVTHSVAQVGISAEPIILGSGNGQFEFKPNAIQFPKESKAVQDYHGIAVNKQGRVLVGYSTKFLKKLGFETK